MAGTAAEKERSHRLPAHADMPRWQATPQRPGSAQPPRLPSKQASRQPPAGHPPARPHPPSLFSSSGVISKFLRHGSTGAVQEASARGVWARRARSPQTRLRSMHGRVARRRGSMLGHVAARSGPTSLRTC